MDSSQTTKEVVKIDMQKSTLSGKALVIDDQQAILSVAEDMLTTRGMQVMVASSGPEGVALFQDHYEEISVVLLDFKMPGMGGDEVYARLQEIDPNVRVIISSGYSEQEMLDFFANSPNVLFIQKPYRYRALVEKVSSALELTQ